MVVRENPDKPRENPIIALFVFHVVVKAAFTTNLATKTLLQNIFLNSKQTVSLKSCPDLVKDLAYVRINGKQKKKKNTNNDSEHFCSYGRNFTGFLHNPPVNYLQRNPKIKLIPYSLTDISSS